MGELRRWFPVDTERHDFTTDILLPSQFFPVLINTSSAARGGQRLLLAVLEDAVHTWLHYGHAQDCRGRRLFEETQAWFWSTQRDYVCAFECICEHLDLDPTCIRRGLLAWQQAETARKRSGPRK